MEDLYRRGYEAVNYRLRTLAGGALADHCRPTSIVFALTLLCNARCVHCDIWKNKGKEDVPTLEDWKTVLTDLRRWLGRVQVTFSGGEALLRKDTAEIVGHGASLGLAVEVLSHGYWDDQKRIEKLAEANPWRLTVSLDGVGEAHTKVRGRERFWEKTSATIETMRRMRKERNLGYQVRLKTVIMAQNMHDVHSVAEYARQEKFMHVFYQPIEQNYSTPEDSRWFEWSENWPRDTPRAVATVERLIAMKREGYPIDNSFAQLEAMIPYFQNPDAMRVAMQSHTAHEHKPICSALTSLQLNPNGDVLTCYGMPPVGNIRTTPVRRIWEGRPRWWRDGCCLNRRCSAAEKENLALPIIS